MPRLPVTDEMALGRLVIDAVQDPYTRIKLLRDPEGTLAANGVTIDPNRHRVIVHEDTVVTIHIAIPYEIDDARKADTDYIEYLGRYLLAGCR